MSIWGRYYRVMTFGESHSSNVGCVIEGFPSKFSVCMKSIQEELNRRRPGQSTLTTPRDEKDQVRCISGMENEKTLGSPICFVVDNENIKKSDYEELKNIPRPGHADYTYLKKYGIKAESGGGRSSARETIGRVIAGALAKQFLAEKGITFASYVRSVSGICIPDFINEKFISEIEDPDNPKEKVNLRCPDLETAKMILQKIKEAKKNNDSVGGIVQGCIYGLPIGLGEPCFDKVLEYFIELPALMAHAMMSIPATKGFDYGSGFEGTKMKGSDHNDKFNSQLKLLTNNSGGTLGGITTGETFHFTVAFKPVSSIGYPQHTHTLDGEPVILKTKGRHDPCVLPRAPPIVDNMAAIVAMDLWLGRNSQIF